jgi:hypothetical protein
MTQPQLTREPEDGRIERWLVEREQQLPPPDRAAVLGRALDRLPQTPQRRRWWPSRWLPFGTDATRSSVPTEPHPEGSTRMMFSATRIAALVAALAVGGSLALVAGPLSPGPEAPGGPVFEAPGPEAAGWFNGSGWISIDERGEEVEIDGVGYLHGQISTMLAEVIEVDDPRAGGTAVFTQQAEDYGGFGPTWGTFRVEDDAGAWVGDVSGVWRGTASSFSGWLIGEGAYEGLIQYRLYDVVNAISPIEFSGITYPADAPPFDLEAILSE